MSQMPPWQRDILNQITDEYGHLDANRFLGRLYEEVYEDDVKPWLIGRMGLDPGFTEDLLGWETSKAVEYIQENYLNDVSWVFDNRQYSVSDMEKFELAALEMEENNAAARFPYYMDQVSSAHRVDLPWMGRGYGQGMPSARDFAYRDAFDNQFIRMRANPQGLARQQEIIRDQIHGARSTASPTQNLFALSQAEPIYERPGGGKQMRDAAGRFSFGLKVKDNMLDVTELARKVLVKSYKEKRIKTTSGTLLEAVENMEIELDTKDGKFELKGTLPNTSRPARANEPHDVPVRKYGPLVFGGRGSIVPVFQRYLRFQVGGKIERGVGRTGGRWITSMNVAAAPAKDIYDLSDNLVEELGRNLASQLAQLLNNPTSKPTSE